MAIDLDDAFAYSTVKVVKIRDRYLGITNYCFMLIIFIYVVINNIIMGLGYIQFEQPKGTVRFQLKRPVNPATPACDPDNSIIPNDPGCLSWFTPTNELPYCKQSNALGP